MRGVIYARYSPGPHQTEQSIEGQVADCQQYAEEHGIDIIEIYADRHVSGKSVVGRDEFQRKRGESNSGDLRAAGLYRSKNCSIKQRECIKKGDYHTDNLRKYSVFNSAVSVSNHCRSTRRAACVCRICTTSARHRPNSPRSQQPFPASCVCARQDKPQAPLAMSG